MTKPVLFSRVLSKRISSLAMSLLHPALGQFFSLHDGVFIIRVDSDFVHPVRSAGGEVRHLPHLWVLAVADPVSIFTTLVASAILRKQGAIGRSRYVAAPVQGFGWGMLYLITILCVL
jgi:hypothetical protein